MARALTEDQLLDRVAGLFAQHGFDHTSLKDLADAVGLSKAGLLHHYPSKEALFEAARDVGRTHSRELFEQVGRVPPGPARDRRAVELLVDFALDRPGLVALETRAISRLGAEDLDAHRLDALSQHVLAVFGVEPDTADTERLVRAIGVLSALAVLSLAANHTGEKTAWRPHIIATCLDALGHRDPSHPEA
ncbi:TetR/AcrR family transcriptional regulator [Saccharothrix sp. 6-C]|uniref:TetR family transcriptional regulator n=1 Tax=Saccharothrix texasensis TaxID=103734 RepID=A0A3N1HEX1_9PSEU|nr:MULTISPECIES: TetR/AcrR family transcriptional regulator [Saccharothrix]QQQ74890.1 TetR/AcrR family transcriptional regulator [Saccharothrix sp. 6-C]ROP41033.1 TetR family transcriptional regulator [Saccharothrix texasensis]